MLKDPNPTDESILSRMRQMVAQDGEKYTDQYDMFLSDNRTFEPYWPEGVVAIRNNTVDELEFGERCLLEVGRKHLQTSEDANTILMELAWLLDHEATSFTKKKS